MKENQHFDKKSIRLVTGRQPDWKALAKSCVCFANSRGGTLFIGFEDKEDLPPENQKIDPDLPNTIKKRISENSINVGLKASIKTASNNSQFIELEVLASESTLAATSDGKYYYRSADSCVALLPDELSRLFTDKPSFVWETKRTSVPKNRYDEIKLNNFIGGIKNSTRVSNHIKQMSDEEILEHYFFVDGDVLTNLGVLWIGSRNDRARISYCPTIQFFKFDESGTRINRNQIPWGDYFNPKELIEEVWNGIPDWKEGVEVADGIFRKFIPNYEEVVIRELLANALVHRPYTMRGDIFINLYPDKLEIVNPGLFPIGVTPQNILHKSVRRNEKLAQVFYDLGLIEKEGSGIDQIYKSLSSNGKQAPIVFEGDDYVSITIRRHIAKSEIVTFINRVSDQHQLSTKEIICLGLIAQHNSLSAIEFSKELMLSGQQDKIQNWLGRLEKLNLVLSKGKTRAVQYFINPLVLKGANSRVKTNLKSTEDHRLKELIRTDIERHQPCPFGDIHFRIGKEIPINQVRKMIYQMCKEGLLRSQGELRWTKYSIDQKWLNKPNISSKNL